MSFKNFIKACKKYGFTYVLSSYDTYTLILRPNDTYENINLEYECMDYDKMFKDAIKAMKSYNGQGR